MSKSDRSVKVVSLSLPLELIGQLDALTKELGVSRSAFVSSYLGTTLPDLLLTLELSQLGSEGVRGSKRYCGAGVDELDRVIAGLIERTKHLTLRDQHDLFEK